ncbi:sigma-70 family RNA polymerase sigma factor [bacterium]|nr:MAG: sigma-70 family RNA polymerase sigma factor [bacterium]
MANVRQPRPLTPNRGVSSYVSEVAVATLEGDRRSRASTGALTPQELWDRYGESVCRFAALVASSDAEAEDIAQESLLRAMRALPRWTAKGRGIEAWLWRIVQNTARDFGRAARRRRMLVERVFLLLERKGQPWPDVDARVESADIVAAIRSLPGHSRTLIGLRFGADLDYESVGKAVGLSPVAARAATRRALLALKQELERRGSR